MHEMQTSQAIHPLLRKWWMRARAVKVEITNDGIGGAMELHCPLWARPLDVLHALLFGAAKLSPA
jgi:hypothetical protein